MSDQKNNQASKNLEQVNDELTQGLKLCHSIIDDYRSKMTHRLTDDEKSDAANDDNVERGESDRA